MNTKDLLSDLVCFKITKLENENHSFMSHIITKILSKGAVIYFAHVVLHYVVTGNRLARWCWNE